MKRGFDLHHIDDKCDLDNAKPSRTMIQIELSKDYVIRCFK